jgi:phosphate transport system substrate-binding protein
MVVCLVLAGACGRHEDAPRTPKGAPVRVDGSSTVYLVSRIVAEEAEKQSVAAAGVDESGATGGFKKFCANASDVSGASRPIQQSELDMDKLLETEER